MAELQNKYDFRSREKSSTNNPPKKPLSRNKSNEAVVSKPSTEIQAARVKQVKAKVTQTKRPENKEVEI
jgi:hypothetical protein